MGSDTQLFCSSRWSVFDVKRILKEHLGVKEITERWDGMSLVQLSFVYNKQNRTLSYFYNQIHGGISGTFLDMGADPDGVKILETIAELVGGFFTVNDCRDEWQCIQGELQDGDGIPYFVKYGILTKGMKDVNDMKGLKESIENWHRHMDSHPSWKKKMRWEE